MEVGAKMYLMRHIIHCSAAGELSEIMSEVAKAETWIIEVDHIFFLVFISFFFFFVFLKRVNSFLLCEKSSNCDPVTWEGTKNPSASLQRFSEGSVFEKRSLMRFQQPFLKLMQEGMNRWPMQGLGLACDRTGLSWEYSASWQHSYCALNIILKLLSLGAFSALCVLWHVAGERENAFQAHERLFKTVPSHLNL